MRQKHSSEDLIAALAALILAGMLVAWLWR